MVLPLIFLFFYLGINSCNLVGDDSHAIIPGKEEMFSGIYTQGIEDSTFEPCINLDERWRFSEIQDTASFFSGLRNAEENPVYMEIRGVPTSNGEYQGFFLVYDRQINVKEVLSVTSLQDKDCQSSILPN